jgi:hypothetical protein
MYTETLTQRLGIAAAVNPQTINNQSKTTGSVDMSLFRRALFLVEIGAVTGGGSINLQLVEDTASNLASATNLGGSNTSITGLTTANKQYTLEARADQLTKRYLGLKITETGSQNVTVCVVALGDECKQKPGNANNDSSVVTQNVVA